MKLNSALKLYGVISKNDMTETEYLHKIEDSIKGGVTMIQVREKNATHEEKLQLCRKVKQLTDQYQIPLIINDDIAICEQIEADGVHLGQRDGSIEQARKRLGANKIIGVSANSVHYAKKAVAEGADYLGTGAMFTTYTKLDAKRVKIKTLNKICKEVNIPVVAIGGIDKSNAAQLKDSGIIGIAVVSALYANNHCYDNAYALRKLVEKISIIRNKLIICDVDGVLLDSVGVWKGIASEYLQHKGIMQKSDLEEMLGTCSFEEGLTLLKDDYQLSESVDEIITALNKIVKHKYLNDVQPKPHAEEFLQAASREYCLYLCSDTNSDVLRPALQKHGLLDYVDALVTSDIAKGSKTNKKIYHYCNNQSGYPINETIILEDFLYAIQTAKKAGYYVIGVQEQHSIKDMNEIKKLADEYIEDLGELEDRI